MAWFNKTMTVAGAVGGIAFVFAIAWAMMTPTQLATMNHVRGRPASFFWGDIGGWVFGLSPFAGILAGLLVLHGRREWWRQVVSVAAGAGVWIVFAFAGGLLRMPP